MLDKTIPEIQEIVKTGSADVAAPASFLLKCISERKPDDYLLTIERDLRKYLDVYERYKDKNLTELRGKLEEFTRLQSIDVLVVLHLINAFKRKPIIQWPRKAKKRPPVGSKKANAKVYLQNHYKRPQKAKEELNIAWAPQPGSQERFMSCPIFECLLEGTRGGGKTDALLMDFAQFIGKGYGADWKGVLFREEYPNLEDVINKSKKWFSKIFPGAVYNEGKHVWKFPDGEMLYFRHAKRPGDYWKYHGHEYPWIGWEELTNWPTDELYLSMMSVCRSSNPNVPRRYRSTCNPYGRGHNWVKMRFIDLALQGKLIIDQNSKNERVYISSSIYENKFLLENDPHYLRNLESLTDQNKKKAWLEGSWDIVAGGMFDDVWSRDVHVIKPFEIPHTWYIDRCFDWGSAAPFYHALIAMSDGSRIKVDVDPITGKDIFKYFPKKTLFVIDEWYGWNGRPNEGIRLTADEVGRGIAKMDVPWLQQGYNIHPGPADSSIYDTDHNNESIARKINEGYFGKNTARDIFVHADKSPGSRKKRWELMRTLFKASTVVPMENPGLYVFNTCKQFVRTIPTLPRDERDPEDIDTTTEDHIADAIGYRVLHRPIVKRRSKVKIG